MSKQQGTFLFPANFEPRVAAPLDTRLVANKITDLTSYSYWISTDGNVYLYKGIQVSVWDDNINNNGVYILTDDNYTDINNWLKVGLSSDSPIDINFGNTETISFLQNGSTYSAFINQDSITASNLKTVDGGATAGYILSNDGVGNFKWIEQNEFDINFENTETIEFTQLGDTYSAFIKPDSITVSNLKTIDGGPTAGYILSNDGVGNFKWVEPIPSEGAITMEDYTTGQFFSNVQNIVIRGGAITVPGGTALGGLAQNTGANTVTVWIPAPNYSPLFNPILNINSVPRYVSSPNISNNFFIGNWNITDDFTNNITRNVINTSNLVSVFFTDEFFNCYGPAGDGLGTTMSFIVYNSNGVVAKIDNFEISESNFVTNDNLTITVTDFENDSDRKKAKVIGNINNIDNIIPDGGRFYYEVIHYNGQPGNELITFTSQDYFYDAPSNQSGLNSTANISGSVEFSEVNNVLRYFSGVAYYTTGTIFGITVSGINLLNQLTFPTDRQLQLTANNMLINNSTSPNINNMRALANGTKGPKDITGWTIDWDSTGLTFSSNIQVNISNSSFPGFSPNTSNNILTIPSSNITANIYDYGVADTQVSMSKLMLFDTLNLNNGSFASNPIIGEGNRLSVNGLLTGGSLVYNSNSFIADDELQYSFGRIIYPQHNYTNFYPSVNNIDYSNLTGSNKAFDVYTDLNILSTSNISIDGYRWYCSNPFGVNSSYNIDFTNGIFTFNSNFTEDDLNYKPITNSSGNGDLVILLGFDPGINSNYPSSFIYLTGDINSYPGRSSASIYNLDGSTKNIQFSLGQISGVRKVWLLVGYKDSTRGRSLILSNVQFV
jgi:hypothetical protein